MQRSAMGLYTIHFARSTRSTVERYYERRLESDEFDLTFSFCKRIGEGVAE